MSVLALTLSLAAAVAVEAPVTAVTVFSDRARVTRTAEVKVSGTDRLELVIPTERIDPASIRVEAAGAEVKRVDLARLEADELPADEARALIEKLETLDDRIARTTAERDAPRALLDTVRALSPIAPPVPTGEQAGKAPPRLNPTSWGATFAFVEDWMARTQGRAREAEEKLIDLGKERRELVERAQLLGGARRRTGWKLLATVAGNGKAKIAVTYMALSARWQPTWDIQLLADQKNVQVAFAGLVSQESGEDWNDATLTLSTAIPATSTLMPKMRSWKIGERERFMPTPIAMRDPPPPPPPPVVPPIEGEREEDLLRARLAQIAGFQGRTPAGPYGKKGGHFDGGPNLDDSRRAEAEKPADYAEGAAMADEEVAAPPPPPPPAMSMPAPMEAPMAPSPSRRRMYREMASKTESVSDTATIATGSTGEYVPTEQVGLAAPPGYRPPSYGPDLPVTLAGGYDLKFNSLRPETIQSGKGARRVALFSQRWPVEVERRVFPALAAEAFLTAEIKNPSSQALPGGPAQLAVGDDPAGTARLNLVAGNEKFVLPLGLDRAIKPIRNVKLVQAEKGIFSKDDFGEYTVTIEIANPYKTPIALRVTDQIPLQGNKDIEVKALPAQPAPSPASESDKIKGSLEWRVTVPAGGKSTIQFGYTIRRPKGWRTYQ